MKIKLCIAALAAAVTVAGHAHANDFEPALRGYLENEIRQWSGESILVSAIQAQNAKTSGLSEPEILELDNTWRNEVGNGNSEIINQVLNNSAADFLRGVIEQSGGVVTEVFLMDSVGLNVAASGTTSDYWQGDEAKHSETYDVGPDAVHIGAVEFDESSQTFQAQVSIPINDPATNMPVGALTVGLNAEALF
ncbi:hypothetical protein [Poseidonocella sedimentorum]|uniref:Uncharacterized protein n=1 Tax=Poseidonocella sedimentorum TaxID=871652 RepID=A0A1I6D327_9RHOB|nr:hypothetical protein [Poseidonocella sedimentorum]SFQ99896.1 hypothetical protein SAMN04515673_10248 [Poseidonocella sedimentorum]